MKGQKESLPLHHVSCFVSANLSLPPGFELSAPAAQTLSKREHNELLLITTSVACRVDFCFLFLNFGRLCCILGNPSKQHASKTKQTYLLLRESTHWPGSIVHFILRKLLLRRRYGFSLRLCTMKNLQGSVVVLAAYLECTKTCAGWIRRRIDGWYALRQVYWSVHCRGVVVLVSPQTFSKSLYVWKFSI